MIYKSKNILEFHNSNREKCISIDVPTKTQTYSPVSHEKIIFETLENLYKNNLNVVSENYVLSAKGNQMIACFNIESDNVNMGMRLMARNSYDKTMSVGYCTGSVVYICSNGLVKGDVSSFKQKHRGNVNLDLSNNIVESVNLLSDKFQLIEKDVNKIKEIEVNKTLISELVGKLFIEEDIITVEQASIIKKELDFSEHFKYDGSLWNFYNNITESLKHGSALNFIKQHEEVHNFILNEFQLV